jgi:hypothetical protein
MVRQEIDGSGDVRGPPDGQRSESKQSAKRAGPPNLPWQPHRAVDTLGDFLSRRGAPKEPEVIERLPLAVTFTVVIAVSAVVWFGIYEAIVFAARLLAG